MITPRVKLLFMVFISFICLSLSPKLISAATYYVAGDVGSDTYSKAQAVNTATPWATIQKAATNVAPGDTVNVKGGITYSTTASCFRFTAVVCLSLSGTSDSYITYQAWPGTGIPIIQGLSDGAGIESNTASGVNYNKILGFEFSDTHWDISIIGVGNIIANNLFYDTVSTAGNQATNTTAVSYGIFIGFFDSGSPSSTNILVYNNTFYQKGIGINLTMGTATIENNLFLNSIFYGIQLSTNGGIFPLPTIDYNNSFGSGILAYKFYNFVSGVHNLTLDPQVVDLPGHNFNLSSSSTLIDAGVNIPGLTLDLAGNSRTQGNSTDIGVYESTYSQTNPPNSIPSATPTPFPHQLTKLAILSGEGSPHGVSDSAYTHLGEGIAHNDNLAVADYNEDGIADIAVGARHYKIDSNNYAGSAYLFYGKSNIADVGAASADVILRSPTGNRSSVFGSTVSSGDINNDGKTELSVSDYDYNAAGNGAAYFFKTGSTFSSRDASAADFFITGANAGSRSSDPTQIVGDVNGDGFSDILYSGLYDGRVYLFWGGTTFSNKSSTDANVVFNVSLGNGCYNEKYLSNVDLNNDGIKDVVISCAYANVGGSSSILSRIYVYFGRTTWPASLTLTDADIIISPPVYGSSSWLSEEAIVAVDFNGDGLTDLVIGDQFNNLHILLNKGHWVTGTVIYVDEADITISGDNSYSPTNLGGGINIADINQDGYLDIVTADYGLSRIYVIYGSSSLKSRSVKDADLIYEGPFGSNLGYDVKTGDVNGDGYPEIISTAFTYDGYTGAVFVLGVPKSIPTNTTDVNSPNTVRGSVTDSASVSHVQRSLDGGTTWVDCTSDDGSFDSTTEAYTCGFSGLTSSDGVTPVKIREANGDGIYTLAANYESTSFTYDSTAPQTTWTDTSGKTGEFKSLMSDNVNTTDTLPTFTFSKSWDGVSGVAEYQIFINDQLYLSGIYANAPSNSNVSQDDDKIVTYDGDRISVQARKEDKRLVSGKAYHWRVRVVDAAGNADFTANKILRVNTHQAIFSNHFFPLSLTSLGTKKVSLSSLETSSKLVQLVTVQVQPKFVGIAEVGATISMQVQSVGVNNQRQTDLNQTTVADATSRFVLSPTVKLKSGTTYYVLFSATNGLGDYTEIPEFALKVGSSQAVITPKIQGVSISTTPTPTQTPVAIVAPIQKPVSHHCLLFWCW